MRISIDVTILICRIHILGPGVELEGVWFIMREELVGGVCMDIEL